MKKQFFKKNLCITLTSLIILLMCTGCQLNDDRTVIKANKPYLSTIKALSNKAVSDMNKMTGAIEFTFALEALGYLNSGFGAEYTYQPNAHSVNIYIDNYCLYIKLNDDNKPSMVSCSTNTPSLVVQGIAKILIHTKSAYKSLNTNSTVINWVNTANKKQDLEYKTFKMNYQPLERSILDLSNRQILEIAPLSSKQLKDIKNPKVSGSIKNNILLNSFDKKYDELKKKTTANQTTEEKVFKEEYETIKEIMEGKSAFVRLSKSDLQKSFSDILDKNGKIKTKKISKIKQTALPKYTLDKVTVPKFTLYKPEIKDCSGIPVFALSENWASNFEQYQRTKPTVEGPNEKFENANDKKNAFKGKYDEQSVIDGFIESVQTGLYGMSKEDAERHTDNRRKAKKTFFKKIHDGIEDLFHPGQQRCPLTGEYLD